MKKILVSALLLCLLATLAAPALASAWGTSVMYVKTENGKSVNVRSSPNLGDNIIGSAGYGHEVLVDWSYAGNDGWTRVVWGSLGDGYIMSRYLVDYKPGPYTPSKEQQEQADAKAEQKKLEKELASEKPVTPFYIAARPSRPTGWVNFRTGPSTISSRISTMDQGRELLVLAETTSWYKAQDTATGTVGYISKTM